MPDYKPVREGEQRPVRRFRVATWASRGVKPLLKSTASIQETLTAKLGFVVFIERTTDCREIDDKMRIHDGHGRKCGRQSGPGQFHILEET